MGEATMRRILTAAEIEGIEIEGRGAYGPQTHAVTYANLGDLLTAVAVAAMAQDPGDPDNTGFLADVRALRFDSMGRDSIAY